MDFGPAGLFADQVPLTPIRRCDCLRVRAFGALVWRGDGVGAFGSPCRLFSALAMPVVFKGLFRASMRVTFVSKAGLGAWPTVTPFRLLLWGRNCAPLSLGSPFGGPVGEADGGGIRQEPLPPPPGAPPPQGEAFGWIYRCGAAEAGLF